MNGEIAIFTLNRQFKRCVECTKKHASIEKVCWKAHNPIQLDENPYWSMDRERLTSFFPGLPAASLQTKPWNRGRGPLFVSGLASFQPSCPFRLRVILNRGTTFGRSELTDRSPGSFRRNGTDKAEGGSISGNAATWGSLFSVLTEINCQRLPRRSAPRNDAGVVRFSAPALRLISVFLPALFPHRLLFVDEAFPSTIRYPLTQPTFRGRRSDRSMNSQGFRFGKSVHNRLRMLSTCA